MLKTPPESDQWFQSYSNWKILKTVENKRNGFLFLAVSHNQCSRLPIDPAKHIFSLSKNISKFIGIYFLNYTRKVKSTFQRDTQCFTHFCWFWAFTPFRCQWPILANFSNWRGYFQNNDFFFFKSETFILFCKNKICKIDKV